MNQVIIISILILFFSCSTQSNSKLSFKLKNTKQLTENGDNGEAYFSSDDKSLIFQSKRDGNTCDKIYTMTIDGEDIKPIPQTDGAFTCSYFSLNDEYIFFSSTLQDGVQCPLVYKDPNPRKYIWPLRNFEIYRLSKDQKLKNLTNSIGYDAEATVHPYEEKIIFTSLRNGDIDLYEMDYDGNNLKKITNTFGYDGGAFYSPDGIAGKLGDNYYDNKINPINKRIDILCSKRDKIKNIKNKTKENKRSIRNINRRLSLLRNKIKNKIRDLHWKTASFLCSNFETIIIQEFETQKMSQKVDKNGQARKTGEA